MTYQGTVAKQDTKHGIWDVIIAIRSYGPVKVANIIINASNCCLYICNKLHLFCKQRSEKCVNQRAFAKHNAHERHRMQKILTDGND